MTYIATAKIWDRDAVVELINGSDKALERALLVIYARQTAEEQVLETTQERNGRGFTGPDAEFLSSVAKALPRYGRMTPRQIARVRPMMRKYWKQLLVEIEGKQGQVSYKVAKSPKSEVATQAPRARASAEPEHFTVEAGAF